MKRRVLGRTKLVVSPIALGSVSLGLDYGIAVPGNSGAPTDADAVEVIRRAADAGINLFDTAPAYGRSERLLGEALRGRPDCIVATKVTIPSGAGGTNGQADLRASLERSLRSLRRDALDIVQIHNATVETVAAGMFTEALLEARAAGLVRFIGASVYGEAAALAVVKAGCFEVLQVAYNVLDQRMASRVLPAAAAAGVGVLVRSAYLKGVLTSRAEWLPMEMEQLRRAARLARDAVGGSWAELARAALRFCLSARAVSSVLVGVRTVAELDEALAAGALGALPPDLVASLGQLALADEHLLNPAHWPIP